MIIYRKADEITQYISNKKKNNISIGFVPTMGALHQGHISLISKSKADNLLTVCSIFINPTQFNNPDDFKKYPITIESDIEMLVAAGCDVLFLPQREEVYPLGFIKTHYELGKLENILEGRFRQGHFQGVCLVVERLLNIIPCDILYLGQKDYQQCMIIEKMTQLRNINCYIKISPTIREKDGLAMSSRNSRLSHSERTAATIIYQALKYIKSNLKNKSIEDIKKSAYQMLEQCGFEVDYIEITDQHLGFAEHLDSSKTLVGLIAATINNIRLIDNMILTDFDE
jgi:pantoate--beta-alanine ligase